MLLFVYTKGSENHFKPVAHSYKPYLSWAVSLETPKTLILPLYRFIGLLLASAGTKVLIDWAIKSSYPYCNPLIFRIKALINGIVQRPFCMQAHRSGKGREDLAHAVVKSCSHGAHAKPIHMLH
jgi:hypothetical protein